MPPKQKLCLPPGGKYLSAASFFQSKPKKTSEEQLVELAAVAKRQLLAKQARDRTALVLTKLGIDAVAKPRSAGRPTAQQVWTDGVRGLVAEVEMGRAEKPREYVVTVPKDWQHMVKDCVRAVGEWHETNSKRASAAQAEQDAVDACYLKHAARAVPWLRPPHALPEQPEQPEMQLALPPAAKRKQHPAAGVPKHHWNSDAKYIFVNMHFDMRQCALAGGNAWSIVKTITHANRYMDWIFPKHDGEHTLKVGTASKWVQAEEQARGNGLPSPFLKEEEPAKKKVKVKGAQKGEATSTADKRVAITAQMNSGGKNAAGHGRLPVLPPQLLIGICCMLFTLSQTGVPMNCAIALPLILNHVHEQGFGHLLHSKQMYTPLATSLKVNGITPERNSCS